MEAATLESPDMQQQLDREKVRELRKALGLSQTEASEAAGFRGGASQWSDIENGHRPNLTLETLGKIASVLKVDVRDLITPAKPGRPKSRGKRRQKGNP